MLLEKKTRNKLQLHPYKPVGFNPLKSELFMKQACRDALVVYLLFFSAT